MKCDICKVNDAVMMIQQRHGSEKSELHLCAECARERGIENHSDHIESTIQRLMKDFTEVHPCSVCGTTLEEVRKQRRVGCPNCYKQFGNEITLLLKKKNADAVYSGSLPRRLSIGRPVLEDRAMLQSKLDAAVASEDYEKAAVYRDRIKALDIPSDGVIRDVRHD
ncbi:MAG: UvrB/UvrC motif-containing protein [Treponemataceae bacterium]|nr:UvrB/UvrC motif-containing protein [Treponemataceae bacterium]